MRLLCVPALPDQLTDPLLVTDDDRVYDPPLPGGEYRFQAVFVLSACKYNPFRLLKSVYLSEYLFKTSVYHFQAP